MSPKALEQLQNEADLIARFAEAYRNKFATLIDRLNGAPDPSAGMASLRLCVEAVDMMLSNQNELARVLQSISEPPVVQQKRAA